MAATVALAMNVMMLSLVLYTSGNEADRELAKSRDRADKAAAEAAASASPVTRCKVAEAKARFSELIDKAVSEGAQEIPHAQYGRQDC